MRCLLIFCTLVLVFTSSVFASIDDYVNDVRELSLGKPSFEAGNKLSNHNQGLKYAEEVSTRYFENDILSPKDYSKKWKWPNGKVYYAFSKTVGSGQKFLIREAMDSIESRTSAVKFIPRKNEDDYVIIDNKKTGCWSALGRVGGQQVINMQHPECYEFDRTPTHMLLHTLGLAHENNRGDRDKYITMQPGNIIQTFEKYHMKNSHHKFKTPYDYLSAMHTTSKTNSDNGFDIFTSKDSNVLTSDIGWVNVAQPSDIGKLEEIYYDD